MIRTTPDFLQQAIGYFGWIDASLPLWTYWFLVAAFAVLVVLGLTAPFVEACWCSQRSSPRILVPALVQGYSVHQTGIIWQGRMGSSCTSGSPSSPPGSSRERPGIDSLAPRVSWVVGSLVALFGVLAFVLVMVRYVIAKAPLGEMFTAPQWQPPLGWSALVIGIWAGFRRARRPGGRHRRDGSPGARTRSTRSTSTAAPEAGAGAPLVVDAPTDSPSVAIAYDCLFPADTGGGERVYRRSPSCLRSGRCGRPTSRAEAATRARRPVRRRRHVERRDRRRRGNAHPVERTRIRRRPLPLLRPSSPRPPPGARCRAPGAQRLRGATRPPAPVRSWPPTGSRSGRGASGGVTPGRSSAPSPSCCSRSACTSVASRP